MSISICRILWVGARRKVKIAGRSWKKYSSFLEGAGPNLAGVCWSVTRKKKIPCSDCQSKSGYLCMNLIRLKPIYKMWFEFQNTYECSWNGFVKIRFHMIFCRSHLLNIIRFQLDMHTKSDLDWWSEQGPSCSCHVISCVTSSMQKRMSESHN